MSRAGPAPAPGFPPQPPQQPQPPRQVPPGYPQQPQFQGFYPPYGQRFGPPAFPPGPGFPPYGVPPGWYPPPGQGFPQGPGQFPPPQVPIGPPGQHGTPPQQPRPGVPGAGPVNLPKAAAELQVSEKASSKPASQNATPAPAAAATAQHAPTPPIESKPSVTEAVQASTAAPAAGMAPLQRVPPTGPRNARVEPAIPIAQPGKPVNPAVAQPQVANAPGNNVSQQAAVTEATRAATAAVAAAMAKLPQPSVQKKPEASVDNVTKQMGELKTNDGSRPHRGGGHRGGRGGGRGQYQGATAAGKKFEVPETDYDFATANARFNKQDLLKEAIGTGSPMTEQEHGPHESEQPEPDSAYTNGSGASGNTYNRTSSFFDNISSEARDREEGTGTRAAAGREWRGEEEKRNIETFGQGSVDGYRGRGRGRGRGYGRGRGGYGRGYSRGRGGFRGRGASQPTGVPTST